ncbi:uncharacterized protein LOC123536584 isoform X2 [Mercenaria mercenaria]|uniref:uncharacterized protein LOC123536584 isoform X2 n=1 Tax=Mercenaria mercenaria TaxID=6596 RepID=UPI00234F6967|nr:uncharacterized protein LOC123536584 isoform X2 [Mercenaria mercenaria]
MLALDNRSPPDTDEPPTDTNPYHALDNKSPSDTDEPPTDTNPYHAGYDQQGAMFIQQPTPGPYMHSYAVVTDQPLPTLHFGRARKRDLTVPAILVCLFCCWCTGIPAIFYASKAQNEYDVGHWVEAEAYQREAVRWIISSFVIQFVIWLSISILYLALLSQ